MQVHYGATPRCGGWIRRSLRRAATRCLTIALALATSALHVHAADVTPNNALKIFTDETSALIKSYGLQKAESAVTVALPTYPGYACPGFYVAQALPGTGFKSGVFGIEFVLTGGATELYGGINFGAGFDKQINGFAAFNINNTSPYQQ